MTFVTSGTVLKFTVKARTETGEPANPVPYTRTTQAAKWNPRYLKYIAWRDVIKTAFFDKHPKVYGQNEFMRKLHPLREEGPWHITTKIYYKSKQSQGDPDNVHKGINDALFRTDKYVCGSYTFGYDKKNPRVEVTVVKLDWNKSGEPNVYTETKE